MRSIVLATLVTLGVFASSCAFSLSGIENNRVFSVSEVHQNVPKLADQKIRVRGILHLEWESDKLIEGAEHKNISANPEENRMALVIDISGFPELRGKEQIEKYWLNRERWSHLNHSCVVVSGTLRTDMPVHLRSRKTIGISNVNEIKPSKKFCGE